MARLRSSFSAGKARNSVTAPPWGPAPTWGTSRSICPGTAVRGTGADSSNIYLCVGTPTQYAGVGTTAASGTGPTGTGTGYIDDGTVRWIFHGRAKVGTGTIPLYSTITPTAAADNMDGFIAVVPFSSFAALGLVDRLTTDAAPIWYSTGGPVVGRAVQPPNQGTVATPSRPPSMVKNAGTLVTNARKWIAIRPQDPIYAMATVQNTLAIEVNGAMLSESEVINQGALVNPGSFLLNLTPFGEGEKVIRVFTRQATVNAFAFSVAVQADEYAYPHQNGLRGGGGLAFEGDSIFQQSFFASILRGGFLESMVGRLLGIDRYYNNAVGATGSISSGSPAGTRTTYIERLPDLNAFGADVIVIGGFHNDAAFTSANRRTAFSAYLTAVRQGNPNALILLFPVFPLQGEVLTAGTGSNVYDVEVDAKFVFDQMADPRSRFVPVLTAAGGARATNTNGLYFQKSASGSYSDGHPIPAFYTYLATWIAQEIEALVASQGV